MGDTDIIFDRASWGLATIFSPNVNLKDLGAIKVVISDMATGGCWTNIKEVKDYAEGKLEIAGADLSYKSDIIAHAGKRNNFTIAVFAQRLNSGLCIGLIRVQLGGYLLAELAD